MITVTDEYRTCKEGRGLSTDQKSMDWGNGSTLLEMDTGKVFIFDKTNSTWREL